MRAVEETVEGLGLKAFNMDELYGMDGRANASDFTKDLFGKGYAFWDRGLSSRYGLGPAHGRDIHMLQIAIMGQQMDRELGAGTFLEFYKRIGRQDRSSNAVYLSQDSGRVDAPELIFYEFGWLHLFDDVYFRRGNFPTEPLTESTFSITWALTHAAQNLFPFIID